MSLFQTSLGALIKHDLTRSEARCHIYLKQGVTYNKKPLENGQCSPEMKERRSNYIENIGRQGQMGLDL